MELGTELVPCWADEMVEGCGEKSSKGVRLGATDGAAVEVVGRDERSWTSNGVLLGALVGTPV